MSEFDLIESAPVEPGAIVGWHSQTVTGTGGDAVLKLSVNPAEGEPAWPVLGEIPGLGPMWEFHGESPFEVIQVGDSTHLLWNGRTLLESWQAPRLFTVEPESLQGLKCRPNEKLPPDFQSALRWDWKITDEQRFYGLGQRSMPLERRGTAPVNWTTDEPTGHLRDTDPLYQAHPLLWGRSGDTWWAVFFPHSPYSRFDLGQERHDRMRWLSSGARLEIHVHAANSPAELHTSLRQLFEAPTAPPLWSFGFHQSRWGYRSAGEVSQLSEEFKSKEIPLDVVHLDIDHMEEYRSFTFSAARFPKAKETIESLKAQGVRTVTIIDPGLRFDPGQGYAACDSGLAGNHFLKSPSGAPVVGYCWPDEALFPDFSRFETRQWWGEQAQFYLDHGVAGLWIDMNEPAIFDKPFWTGGAKQLPMPLDTPSGEDDRRFQQAAGHNLYGSFMAQATHETWNNDGRRSWILTRSGFTGVGRYAWSWMGDNTSWWEHLSMSLPQLASMGLVGSPFVGVDIGGFFGHCTPELYSAWIETSVIYPFMRAHSALGTRVAHPWSFGPEVEEVARTAIKLRYRLLPYLYSAAMTQPEGDIPLLRPLFFDYPRDERFAYLEDQVMVGPHLMAAPFVVRGQNERLVRLPEGVWYDLHSKERHQGPSTITIARRPGLVPLFAKAGSVIPMLAKDVANTDAMRETPWTLHLFPGVDGVASHLYWDDGESRDHEQGRFLKLALHLEGERLIVEHSQGEFSGPRPRLEALRPGESAGEEIAWGPELTREEAVEKLRSGDDMVRDALLMSLAAPEDGGLWNEAVAAFARIPAELGFAPLFASWFCQTVPRQAQAEDGIAQLFSSLAPAGQKELYFGLLVEPLASRRFAEARAWVAQHWQLFLKLAQEYSRQSIDIEVCSSSHNALANFARAFLPCFQLEHRQAVADAIFTALLLHREPPELGGLRELPAVLAESLTPAVLPKVIDLLEYGLSQVRDFERATPNRDPALRLTFHAIQAVVAHPEWDISPFQGRFDKVRLRTALEIFDQRRLPTENPAGPNFDLLLA